MPKGATKTFPYPIRLPNDSEMAPDATLDLVMVNHNDGTVDVVKTIVFVKPVLVTFAKTLFAGEF